MFSQNQNANNMIRLEAEAEALQNVTEELAKKIFELAKDSHVGDFLCLHVKPTFDNFGSVAHFKVMNKTKQVKESTNPPRAYKNYAMDEATFKAQMLGPAVQRGRGGYSPIPLPLELNLGDEVLSGTMALYVGMRRS